MTISNGYASLDDLKAWVGIIDPNDDTNLERCVEAASRSIDRFCGRRFYKDETSSTKVFTATSSQLVYVDDFWTTGALTVAVDWSGDGDYEETWTLGTDFRLEPANTLPYYRLRAGVSQWWPCAPNAVQVNARWGWTTVPVEVEQACLIKAARLFLRKQTPTGVQGSDQFGFIRITNREDPDVVDLLASLRRGDTATAFGLA